MTDVIDHLVAWVEANPGVRRALPWASGLVVGLGLVVVLTSLGGGGEEPAPVATPSITQDLEKAASAAREYQSERVPPTFEGFNITTAEGMEPSLTWVKGIPTGPGEIEIRVAKSKNLLLIGKDGSDTFCLALDAAGQTQTGRVDAEKSGECEGGW